MLTWSSAAFYTVLGGLAEFEHDLIPAAPAKGASAPRRGASYGMPPVLTRHRRDEAREALANGTATQADLARRFNVSQRTISRLA